MTDSVFDPILHARGWHYFACIISRGWLMYMILSRRVVMDRCFSASISVRTVDQSAPISAHHVLLLHLYRRHSLSKNFTLLKYFLLILWKDER